METKDKIEAKIQELQAIKYFADNIESNLKYYDENCEYDRAFIKIGNEILSFLEKKASV